MDTAALTTAIEGAGTDVYALFPAILGVLVAIWGFRKVSAMIGR